MFAHAHLYNLNLWLIIVGVSRKVGAVLLFVSLLFLSSTILNLNRNSKMDRPSYCFYSDLISLNQEMGEKQQANFSGNAHNY